MMGKKFLKLPAILTAVVFMLSFTACGAQSGNQPASSDTSAASASDTSTTAAADATTAVKHDPLEKYDPPIELTTVMAIDLNLKYPPGDSAENNVWIRDYAERLGIGIKYLWTIDNQGSNYQQKLNMSIAANDLPDIIPCDPTTYKKLVNANMLADLTDAFDQYASDLYKESIAQLPEGFDSAKVNGRLMAIPDLEGAAVGAGLVWLRDDWMKKLNLQPPKTYDELVAIMDAFTNKDPDGNNKNDTLGLPLDKDLFGGFSDLGVLFNAFHAYTVKSPTSSMWIKDPSGKLVYSMIQPEVKNALKAAQDLYKRGLIDKEFGVKDGAKSAEDIAKGIYGVELGANWNSYYPFDGLIKNDANATWTAYPLVSTDGQVAKTAVDWPVWSYYAVNKNCKNPEAIIKMTNLTMENFFGPNADMDKYSTGPNHEEMFKYALIMTRMPNKDLTNGRELHEAFATGDGSKISQPDGKMAYANALKWINDKTQVDGWEYYAQAEALYLLNGMQDRGEILINGKHGPDTDTEAKLGPTLNKDMITVFTKIIMGDPIDNFDKWVASWKAMGGDTITQEMNALYGSN